MGIVRAAAAGVCRRSGGSVDRDELLSAGFAGLVEAAHRYRPDRGAAFATYAYHRVVGAMRDELRAPSAGGQEALAETVEDPDPAPDARLAAREALATLDREIRALPSRERELVERCYLGGLSLRTAAAELGLSTSRASRLRRRALATLRTGVERALGA